MRKLTQALLCVGCCFLAIHSLLLAQANETFTICEGETIFLSAIQSFIQPLQGPSGGVSFTPLLSSISIDLVEGTMVNELAGQIHFWEYPFFRSIALLDFVAQSS